MNRVRTRQNEFEKEIRRESNWRAAVVPEQHQQLLLLYQMLLVDRFELHDFVWFLALHKELFFNGLKETVFHLEKQKC